jgi:tetratricopeptide (TPR) repeat protein
MRGVVRWVVAGFVLALLGACAPLQQQKAQPVGLWRDQLFDYDPALVTVNKQQLFQLPPALLAELREPTVQNGTNSRRMTHLVDLLFDPQTHSFAYGAGQTSTASETWSTKRGDCLSLTVLAYAIARELALPALMQEVQVPVIFDRRGELDYLNGHVNVFIRENSLEGVYTNTFLRPGTIIDFEPQNLVTRLGQPLSDQDVLARYYNNIAVDHLAHGRNPQAYAYFKAAILTDPSYPATFSNLALLYQRKGLNAEAEQLLRHAIVITSDGAVPMRALHRMLVQQGRLEEAARYKEMLLARQEKDPYYWIGLGADQLKKGDYPSAVSALERAQDLATGFPEIHRYLAVAYSRVGKQGKARDQLATLAEINSADPYLPLLTNKLARISAGQL